MHNYVAIHKTMFDNNTKYIMQHTGVFANLYVIKYKACKNYISNSSNFINGGWHEHFI